MITYITDDVEIYSNDSDKENSDEKDLKRMILTMLSFLGELFIYNCFWTSDDVIFEGAIYMLQDKQLPTYGTIYIYLFIYLFIYSFIHLYLT